MDNLKDNERRCLSLEQKGGSGDWKKKRKKEGKKTAEDPRNKTFLVCFLSSNICIIVACVMNERRRLLLNGTSCFFRFFSNLEKSGQMLKCFYKGPIEWKNKLG